MAKSTVFAVFLAQYQNRSPVHSFFHVIIIIQNINFAREKLVIPSHLISVIRPYSIGPEIGSKNGRVLNPSRIQLWGICRGRWYQGEKRVSTFLPQMGMSPCHRPSLPQLMVGFLTGRQKNKYLKTHVKQAVEFNNRSRTQHNKRRRGNSGKFSRFRDRMTTFST